MKRPTAQELAFFNLDALGAAGLTVDMVVGGLIYTYQMLDTIDAQLVDSGAFRMTSMFELANVSSMVGNLLGAGVAQNSNGAFRRNGPHKYPDLLAQLPGTHDVEIKVAMETNRPKGHLAKSGFYLTCRYVLCDEQGKFTSGKENRGGVIWIWEMRIGFLEAEHFNLSNSEGDSGKTAVVNSEGMKELAVVFVDLERCPHPINGKTYKALKAQHPDTLKLP